MNQVLGQAALVGLLLSLVVHSFALAGIDLPGRFPGLCMLHVGAMALCIAAALSSRKTIGRAPTLAALRAAFPRWVIVIGGLLFAYALLNFVLFMLGTEGGSPADKGGAFVLESHGRFIRSLSHSEYWAFKANEVRGFSGHWLVFYFLPFAYFMFRKTDGV